MHSVSSRQRIHQTGHRRNRRQVRVPALQKRLRLQQNRRGQEKRHRLSWQLLRSVRVQAAGAGKRSRLRSRRHHLRGRRGMVYG